MASSKSQLRSLSALKQRLARRPHATQRQSMIGSGVQVQIAHGDGNIQIGGNLVVTSPQVQGPRELQRAEAKSVEQWAKIEALREGPTVLDGWQASNPARWAGTNDPNHKPPGEGWAWVVHETAAGDQRGQWYRWDERPANAVQVREAPLESRPAKNGPIRKLLGYLIRTWLRAWLRRLDDR